MLANLKQLSSEHLQQRLTELKEQFETYKQANMTLDMSRGKPSPEQLDLSNEMLSILDHHDRTAENGVDIRNYGQLDGIPEAKSWFASILHVEASQVIVGGNSSLSMMHDTVARGLLKGVEAEAKPWSSYGQVKFLCPSPGYDRHFAICEFLGVDMIPVSMTDKGPDMDEVEALVREDETIKGMWCVPKYSNPEGVTYSDDVVKRLASMDTKADDFRIFWDNAYTIHHLTDQPDELADIMAEAKAAGHPNRVYVFASTSKVTFPGAGISAFVSSEDNVAFTKKQLGFQTIGADKINQLRHVRFFEQQGGVEPLMKKHAAIIKPKFDLVIEKLQEKLGDKGIVNWTEPNGGYFISVNTEEGCAKRIVSLCKEAGLTLTGAGATFPYGKDPLDRNIRIAPTFPTVEELKQAMDVFCDCVELVTIERWQSN
ncbi:aminotransferase class I/II-fold pyridoxal phosphate-dependent enzyme [Alkalihalobacillus sp. LMS6]|uniref:aminotransferase class I/II-fold pyridoxal phosphate-dependent enzyme n=1 Tax=Alkalihalobacillus sp. LMS6 TaxID=2924034 RepID=UPI0020D0D492|nr:aminotransferase class I/II-fold pyridoxal phosphate-dependent enzyme [Alkalihalobacillus sp. LMS6]UTR05789.1 aminotransferase class I/II-fold pyridoxal phosphate-dependent enzyme [Alkalihalobacillus sp. LMS6]